MTAGKDTGRAPGRRRGEASVTETGDGVLAWKVLLQVGEYGEAWRRHAAAAGVPGMSEPGPFPIRIQTEADLEVERFEMLAWEDPWKADAPPLALLAPGRDAGGCAGAGRGAAGRAVE